MFLQEAQLQVQVEVAPDMTTDGEEEQVTAAGSRQGDWEPPTGQGTSYWSGSCPPGQRAPRWRCRSGTAPKCRRQKQQVQRKHRSNRRLRSLLSVGANGGENQQSSKP